VLAPSFLKDGLGERHNGQIGARRNITISLQVCAVPVGAALAGDGSRSGPGKQAFARVSKAGQSRRTDTYPDTGVVYGRPANPVIMGAITRAMSC